MYSNLITLKEVCIILSRKANATKKWLKKHNIIGKKIFDDKILYYDKNNIIKELNNIIRD